MVALGYLDSNQNVFSYQLYKFSDSDVQNNVFHIRKYKNFFKYWRHLFGMTKKDTLEVTKLCMGLSYNTTSR